MGFLNRRTIVSLTKKHTMGKGLPLYSRVNFSFDSSFFRLVIFTFFDVFLHLKLEVLDDSLLTRTELAYSGKLKTGAEFTVFN